MVIPAAIAQACFEQYAFAAQWRELRAYAHAHGVQLFGDLPLFVAHDSADVWAAPQAFVLDEAGQPTFVAGVPPDYFAADGQRWGNPHYRWDWHQAQDFAWWRSLRSFCSSSGSRPATVLPRSFIMTARP